MKVQIATVKAESFTMDFFQFGHGKEILVILPGLSVQSVMSFADTVADAYQILADRFTVCVFDRRKELPAYYPVEMRAQDTVKAFQTLGLNRISLFGASQGGSIAQDLAIHHPELVRKLVLGVTLSRPNPVAEKSINTWVEMVKGRGLTAVAEDYTYKGFSESYLKKNKIFIPLSLKLQKFMDKERFVALAKAVLTVDTYDRLNEIKCPVLVLGGGQDKIASREASVEIAEKLGCEYYIYEDLGHEAYSESKDFNRRIYDFFKKEN